ncbi:ABC transporter ATP-binding protein [Nocardioides jishulii]|uniref:ABC transporter ATP-binding protein n=2 Tax=Nocardioides jishulii TaxID=2575440 RepID=A0A4U2YW18_9ACTN|nr:ABC transporter ATP-binding protein [Nocardioides jishulii]TKI64952.1 ABC transporter ATP-binding protein [Nocardioides jishulii]
MDFGRVMALHELTLSIGPGVTGLVGANGAGKSTLIKILLGLQTPTAGTATVLGHDVAREADRIRALVGYMPEHDCLPPDVTASEFVVHLARMSGLPAAPARERAADTLRIVGLDEERYRLLGGYSTGMKQRAKLAQALVHHPSLVFLDEPTNGLDPASRLDMLRLVRRISTDFKIPVLVTSHLLGELERVSDHVVVLDAGVLLRSSATSQFLEGTGATIVEVLGGTVERDQLGNALAATGLRCHPRGTKVRIDTPPPGVDVHRLVRDTVTDLDLALVRIEPDHGHLEDVFTQGAHRV